MCKAYKYVGFDKVIIDNDNKRVYDDGVTMLSQSHFGNNITQPGKI